MSLNFEFTKIENYQEKCWIPDGTYPDGKERFRVNPVTESLIFATMPLGMSEITEANAEEFAERLLIFQEVNGAMMYRDGEDWTLGLKEVREHIGLRTNASRRTRAQFDKLITNKLKEHARSALKNARHSLNLPVEEK